jgi:hypothetical protein
MKQLTDVLHHPTTRPKLRIREVRSLLGPQCRSRGGISKSTVFMFVLLWALLAAPANMAPNSMINSPVQHPCGPPSYCSRTDLSPLQLPSLIPNVGNLAGANRVVEDPNFNSRIVRVTDANTDPLHRNYTFIASASGSAEENLWNTDSTLFISYNTGAGVYPFTFDRTTMRAARLYASEFPSTEGMSMSSLGQWSRVNSQVLYVMNGTQLQKYDVSNRKSPPSSELVYDYKSSPNCLGHDFPSNPWFTLGGVAAGDSAFAMGFSKSGSQDSPGANFVVVYTVGKGCRVYNTASGQVSGDWGPTGAVNIPGRVHIHNAKLSKDGNWVYITWNNCANSSCPDAQPLFWNVPTQKVYLIGTCPSHSPCPAHQAAGYTHFFFEDGNAAPNFDLVPFSNLNSPTLLNPNQPPDFSSPWDQHPSWNNVSNSDDTPVCTSSFIPPGAPAKFAFAWQDEVLCIATDGSGKVWRFAHTFNSDRSQRFSTSEAIGTVSQDGRFFIFSSDWMGTLGSESGSPTCTIGTDCRGDVFIVELK